MIYDDYLNSHMSCKGFNKGHNAFITTKHN